MVWGNCLASLSRQVGSIKRRKMVLTLYAPSAPKSTPTFLTSLWLLYHHLLFFLLLLTFLPHSSFLSTCSFTKLLKTSLIWSFIKPVFPSCVPLLSNYCTGWRRLRWHAGALSLWYSNELLWTRLSSVQQCVLMCVFVYASPCEV